MTLARHPVNISNGLLTNNRTAELKDFLIIPNRSEVTMS